jgi:hypothetical protein
LEDNIKRDLKETGCENVGCIHLAQDRIQRLAVPNVVMNFGVSKKAGNFLTS